MSGKVFLDTNLIIYLYSEKEPVKREAVCQILNKYNCVTNIQSLKEASNVWFRKFGWDGPKIKEHLDNVELVCDEILQISRKTIDRAIDAKDRYGFSFYDCVMLASALEGNCDIIFSEDMNDGQIIDGKLKIANPFGIPKPTATVDTAVD